MRADLVQYIPQRKPFHCRYDFSKEEKTVDISSPLNIVFVVELGLSAEVKVETVTISGQETTAVRAGASGETNTGLTFKRSMGYNIEDGMYLGFELGFDGIILKVNGEAKYEEEKKGVKTLSMGPELNGKFTLIESKPKILKGEVFPFRNTDNK